MNDLLSLSKIFDESIYRIPDYQRGYAWTQTQLEDFWEDLDNLSNDRNHYIGMLSLKELKNEDDFKDWEDGDKRILKEKKYKAFHVVDGQQRLTTFVIFISCILEIAEKNNITYLNGSDLEEIKTRYIVEYKKPEKIIKSYKFGYEKDNPSFEFLRYKILGENASKDIKESFYTLNLETAKLFFNSKLEIFFKEKGTEGLKDLFKKTVNQLQFNIHYIEDDFDVFVAFETMNNRGKKLSNLEILKNRLIYLTTIYDDSVLDQYSKNQLRKDINDAWKEVYYELGRNKNNPLNDDTYLKNHWTLYFKYSRNKGDDYIKFLLGQYFTSKAVYGLKRSTIYSDYVENDIEDDDTKEMVEIVEESDDKLKPNEIKDYVDSLKSVVKYWYYSFNPNQSPFMNNDEIEWVNKLNHIGINYYRTLVVASFVNSSISSEQRIRLFKVIEKSIFMFFRMAKWQSNYQSTVSYNYARELMKDQINIETIIEELENKFRKNEQEATEAFVQKITTLFKNNDGFYSWNGLKYFLFEYEMKLYEKTYVPKLTDWDAFTKNEKDHISIEHIFPQTPTRYYWRNQFRDYTNNIERHNLTNSLGNLLALSQSVNSALQNDEYEQKKEGYNKRKRGYKNGSYSEIEVATNYADWNPKSIKSRGLHLLDFMENRWDFKFKDEDTKLKALGLEFMKEERIESPELIKPAKVNRDEILSDDKDAIKVNDYLENKNPQMVELYNAFFLALKERIEGLYEIATNPYIALRNELKKNIAEVRIQNKQIRLNIHKPTDESLQTGELNPKTYRWSLEYRIFIKNLDDIQKVVDAVEDSYNQMIK